MIFKQDTETQQIKDEISSDLKKKLPKEDCDISQSAINNLANLIGFLVNSNEVSVYFDPLDVNDGQIMISVSGSYIDFSMREPKRLSELLDQVSATSLRCHNTVDNKLVFDIVMPNIIVGDDEHE